MVQSEERSVLSTHMWDVRASIEAQLRCLTSIQRSLLTFRSATVAEERAQLRAKILGDLADLERLSSTVVRMLKPTIEEAHRDLDAA